MRLDAYKFVVAYRRPTPERVKDLGVWTLILDAVSNFAVLTNVLSLFPLSPHRGRPSALEACVIAFTSDFVPRLLYQLYPLVGDGTSLHGYFNWTLVYYDVSNYKLTHDVGVYNLSQQFSPPIQFCRSALALQAAHRQLM